MSELQIWHPISTVPTGERVLLWFPQLGYAVTGFPEAYGYRTGNWKATHWAPLPESPNPTTGNAGG